LGINAYIEQQLDPETIPDPTVDELEKHYTTLQMSTADLLKDQMEEAKRFIKKQKKEGSEQESTTPTLMMESNTQGSMQQIPTNNPLARFAKLQQQLASRYSLRAIGELQEDKIMRAILSERQLQEVLVDFWSNHFNIDVKKNRCRVLKVDDEKNVIRKQVFGKFRDMLEASAKSPAMLVYLDNAQNSTTYTVSPFRQKMEQMYLKKKFGTALAQNILPESKDPAKPIKRGGINENYAREIMELHTLGVDGGYTQKDVEEVARCFTGWGLDPIHGTFVFRVKRHDEGEKHVLGHTIPANGGIEDGEQVLDILASHPSTAKHIARELCQRFISDHPSEALVNRIAGVFQNTDGDLREVVKAIITSPEFFAPQNYRAKIKSPFEFVVSAVRASGATLAPDHENILAFRTALEGAATLGHGGDRLAKAKVKTLDWYIYDMGQPLFACTPPTGYSEESSRWVSSGALLQRLQFAIDLTEQKVYGVKVNVSEIVDGVDTDHPQALFNRISDFFLYGDMSDRTRKTLEKSVLPTRSQSSQTVHPLKLISLIIGSPEFQRR
jgi:uncharacterized protein (DUF1800 family)